MVRSIERGDAGLLAAMRPPFSFRSCRKENGPRPVQKKRTPRRVGLRKRIPPAAGGGWLASPRGRQHQTRCPGESFGLGKSRMPCLPLSAGATSVVNAGRRGRRPLQDDACRGGCPHPPVSSPHLPPSKAQAKLEGQAFRQAHRNFYQPHNRGARPMKLSGPARAGRRPPCLSRKRFRRPSY